MVTEPEPNTATPVHYLLDAAHSGQQAQRVAAELGVSQAYWLSQRDSRLGWIGEQGRPPLPTPANARRAWQAAQPVMLPGLVAAALPAQRRHIAEATSLMQAVLDGADCETLLLREPYAGRLAPRFDLLASSFDEGDPQEIVKIEFDVMANETVIAENLWVKLSWLSYEEQDASLRFRFSFGLENYEDVAADPERQGHAAALTEAIFPESTVISANPELRAFLLDILQTEDLAYVERIVYFNAPEGGAQFHHDVERGHAGVVYAQLSGRTAWLALSTSQLLDALQSFLARPDADLSLESSGAEPSIRAPLIRLAADRDALAELLSSRDDDSLEFLINRVPAFTRQLIAGGHVYILHPGDVILLPQYDAAHCSWHAVYCLDEVAGEGLSFAVRHAAR